MSMSFQMSKLSLRIGVHIKRVRDRKGYRVCVIWNKCDRRGEMWTWKGVWSFGFT